MREIKLPELFMSIDVESIGLHGEAYSVGWVIFEKGKEIECGFWACPQENAYGTEDDRKWVVANCPFIGVNCANPQEVKFNFFKTWLKWKERGAILLAECSWPVETNFFSGCIKGLPKNHWDGPYPLHDIATARLVSGFDPLAVCDRKENEIPKHNPVADARQSARLFLECFTQEAPNEKI